MNVSIPSIPHSTPYPRQNPLFYQSPFYSLTTLLNPCFATCALAAATVAALFGSTNPHPVFPFCKLAACALHTPFPELATLAQHAELQSAFDTHPPVMNCAPLPAPTFFAPALLGVTCARERVETVRLRLGVLVGFQVGLKEGRGEKGRE